MVQISRHDLPNRLNGQRKQTRSFLWVIFICCIVGLEMVQLYGPLSMRQLFGLKFGFCTFGQTQKDVAKKLAFDTVEDTTADPGKADILVMILGEKNTFAEWHHRLTEINGQITFIYASYDESIPSNELPKGNSTLKYETLFFPGATWTEGRIKLGIRAIELEWGRKKKFDFWVFSDNHVTLQCDLTQTGAECWQYVFDSIRNDLPTKINMVAIPSKGEERPSARSVNFFEPFFNAYRRAFVPYHQPYFSLEPGVDDWNSHLALMYVVQLCASLSVYNPPHVYGENTPHRDYPVIFDVDRIIAVFASNNAQDPAWVKKFTKYISLFDSFNSTKTSSPVARNVDELDIHIPTPILPNCIHFKNRFLAWEKSIIQYNNIQNISFVARKLNTPID